MVVFKDITRLNSPPIDQNATKELNLPEVNEPYVYEDWVEEEIEYKYDFETYDVFWYIPTTDEIIEKGKGDCKGRAILLASIFEAKNISYELHISPYHWWISYPQNPENIYEEPDTSLRTGENWKLPDFLMTLQDVWDVKDQYYEMTWIAMPNWKKAILIIGSLGIWAPPTYNYFKRKKEEKNNKNK